MVGTPSMTSRVNMLEKNEFEINQYCHLQILVFSVLTAGPAPVDAIVQVPESVD